MKKMAKILSVVMVISMMFSMTASAFAGNTGFVLPGGASSGSSSGASNSGSSSGTSVSANTKPSHYTAANGETVSTSELEVDATAEAPQYIGRGDIEYADLTGSDDPNIANNADFIMYVHDNMDDTSLVSAETLQTAINIFGSNVIQGDLDETEEDKEEEETACEHVWTTDVNGQQVCSLCGKTYCDVNGHSFATDSTVCSVCSKNYCDVNGHSWKDNGDGTSTCTICSLTQGTHVHSYSEATCTTPETCSCGDVRGDALGHQYENGVCRRCGAPDPNYVAPATAETPATEEIPAAETPAVTETSSEPQTVAEAEAPAAEVTPEAAQETTQEANQETATEQPLATKSKVIHAEAISYRSAPTTTSTTFSSSAGSSLIGALNNGPDNIYLASSFDICNSTEYRITIDLRGKTIYAPGGNEAAFVIRNRGGAYATTQSPVTFTNGFIEGNGFYVCDYGILNLGGLINISGLDIRVQNGSSYAVYVANTGTAVIGQGTELRCAADDTLYIEAGGQARVSGGTVTCTAAGRSAVYNNGYFLFNSTGSNVNNSYGILQNDSYVAVTNEGEMVMGAGTVIGATGIAVSSTGSLNIYNGTVTGNGSSTDSWPNCGAAVAVYGEKGGAVTASGGALRSEKTAAIKLFKDDGTRFPASSNDSITRITLFSAGIITQELEQSNYRVSKFTVNDIGYATYADAVNAANTTNATTVTIKMGGDYEMTTTDASAALTPSYGAQIIFDGNGCELSACAGCNGITANAGSGSVTIRNITIYGDNTKDTSGVCNDGGNVTVGGDVTIRKFDYGVKTNAGSTYINDVYIPDSVNTGIYANGGTTTVAMVTDDCDTPVNAAAFSNLDIRSGWFKRSAKKGDESNPIYKVSNYIDSAQSHLKYIDDDGYYEVLFNDEPTVEIVSAEVLGSYTVDDETYVYLAYDKGDATPIIFKFEAGCTQINAVSLNSGKTVYPLFSSSVSDNKGNLTGTSGNVRIADQQVLMDLPAGVYDIQFTFANSSTISGKMFLQVYPKVAQVFEVPNTTEMATLAAKTVKEYISSDYILDSYNVADGNNFAVVMSELPMKIAVGSNSYPYESDVTDTTYLEYYLNDGSVKASIQQIPADTTNYGSYAGNYIFFVSYADVNNLAAGQNYLFLDYGESLYDIEKKDDQYAYIYFPFTVTNSSVSISPASLEWTTVSGTYANFTIKPDVLNESSVFIDGENVDKAYWTYDEDTYVLAIKSSYLNALDKSSHTLEVITSMGKVGATINTKIGLMAKSLDYHVYGGAKSLSFVASDKINKEGGIWIGASNPTQLDSSCYVWDSEYGFTLSAAFLNRLSLGTYYVSAYVWNGTEYEYSTTSFKVISASQASYNPSTGDNSHIFIWLIVLVLSAVAIIVIVLPRFKKKAAEGADVEEAPKKKSSHLK